MAAENDMAETDCVAEDAVMCQPVSSLQFAICREILTKCREEPIQFLAESHCAVRSSEDSSLSKEQGGASRIAGKSRVANWLVAGITDRPGAKLTISSSSDGYYERLRDRLGWPVRSTSPCPLGRRCSPPSRG
jgi:hypothetical protein